MSLETIFKFIRNEDVVIWLGAGFSSYAGYPSGTQLQKTIYSELSSEEKQQVDLSSSLRKTAGAMVTFHENSRNELNRILIREFSKEPTSRYFHDLISHIPHFKSIITTNYDSLIEDSYDRRANVIRFGKDVPYVDSQKIKIYKPHGDLKSKDQIIITDNDYAKFYSIDYKDPFWISLLNDIIKKNILFIGYGFEDDNVWSWFDFIDKQLGVDRKQRFLISPDWPSLKTKELQTRHVSYINSTADKFLAELNEHLKLNIIADLENGIVTQDTFNKFIDFHNLNSQILNENGKPILTSLYNSQNEVNGKLNIKLTDKYVLKHFKKFNQGFGNEIKITRDQIDSFEHYIEGFKMNINKETLDHLIIKRSPNFHQCSIEIPEKDLLVENIQFELCKINKNKTKIEVAILGFKLNIFVQYKPQTLGADITFDFKLPEKFPSISNCILFYQALINYLEGEKLIFYFNNSTSTATAPVHSLNSDILIFRKTLKFFENLRKIEKAFLIKFEGAKAVFSKSNFTLLKSLSDLIDNKYIPANFKNGVRIYRNDNKPLKELPDHIESFFIRFDDKEFVELYGHKIDLGERGLEIINIEPLILEPEGISAIAKSRTGQYLQRYSSVYSFDSIKYID